MQETKYQTSLIKQLQDEKMPIAMPNELFNQLIEMNEKSGLKSVHIGFTYSYIYLQTYMYRYTTYGGYIPSQKEVKEVLTYSSVNKGVDYIIKKDGLLEKHDILLTTKEFPVLWGLDEDREITFMSLEDYCEEYSIYTYNEELTHKSGTARSECKYPEFAFDRYKDEDGIGEAGTFYDISDTTMLDMPTFLFCMQTDGIGVNGFYLYAYLKHQSFKFKGDFRATAKRISSEVGLSERAIKDLMNTMREHNLITTIHNMEYFSLGIKKSERKASTHKVNDVSDFTIDKIEYEKMETVPKKDHKLRRDSIFNDGNIEISISDLPF